MAQEIKTFGVNREERYSRPMSYWKNNRDPVRDKEVLGALGEVVVGEEIDLNTVISRNSAAVTVVDCRDDSIIVLRGRKGPWTVRQVFYGMINHPHYQGDQGDHHYLDSFTVLAPATGTLSPIIQTSWSS